MLVGYASKQDPDFCFPVRGPLLAVLVRAFISSWLALLGPQSRFGDKLLEV